MRRALLAAVIAILPIFGLYGEGHAARIGAAAIVKREVQGTIPGATSPRSLVVGDGVFQNETIQTGTASHAQLMFLDQTVLSIGPKSRLALTKVVYNPQRNVGQFVLNAGRGVFQFFGGTAESKPGSDYKIKTPIASIGIRGTYFEWIYDDARHLLWAVLFTGRINVCANAGPCADLTHPGTYVVTNGQTVSDVRRWQGRNGPAFGNDNLDQLYNDFLGGQRPDTAPTIPAGSTPVQEAATAPPPPVVASPAPTTAPPIPVSTPPVPVTPPPIPVATQPVPITTLPSLPPPTVGGGFPPVVTGNGTVPAGLSRGTLPPGLVQNRDPVTFLPPGRSGARGAQSSNNRGR